MGIFLFQVSRFKFYVRKITHRTGGLIVGDFFVAGTGR